MFTKPRSFLQDLHKQGRNRRYTRKYRKETGSCDFCGKDKRCEQWCWGPPFLSMFWFTIKKPYPSRIKYMWRIYREELKWVGVEPWHRY